MLTNQTNDTQPGAPAPDSGAFFNMDTLFKNIEFNDKMHIADFGAGSGYITFKIAQLLGRGGFVYALDVKKSVIEHLNSEIRSRGIQNAKAVWTNLEMLNYNPVPSQSIDIVMVINMLFQSTKHRDVLTEAKRILKYGGQLVIIDWRKGSGGLGPPNDDRVVLDKIKEIAYSLELNKIKEFSPGSHHFGIVFKK